MSKCLKLYKFMECQRKSSAWALGDIEDGMENHKGG